jgi:hypothetical protein
MRKLPVFRSFGEVYAGVFTHFFELARAAWLPLALWVAIGLLAGWWMSHAMFAALGDPTMTPEEMSKAQAAAFLKIMPQFYGLTVLQFLLLPIAAVDFHRFVLLGERRRGVGGSGFDFGRKEWLYIWSSIKLFLLFVLLMLPVFGVLMVVGAGASILTGQGLENLNSGNFSPNATGAMIATYFVAIFALLIVSCRLTLVLPHVALGNPSELRFIWDKTRGNIWRLFGYFLLMMLSFLLVMIAVQVLLGLIFGMPLADPKASRDLIHGSWKTLAMVAIWIPVQMLWMMLSITMLSVAYREIVGLPGQAAEDVGKSLSA